MDLNCDGTTLSQKKLQGAAINGIVLSVSEIPDGSADSVVAGISHGLHKLRDIAHALKLPIADKINWALIKSSTQKRFNKLVEENREEDNEHFGLVGECPDWTELVGNIFCMHLGVNLRKAFFESEESGTDDASSIEDAVLTFSKRVGGLYNFGKTILASAKRVGVLYNFGEAALTSVNSVGGL